MARKHYKKKSKPSAEDAEPSKAELDRFAGSSDEEEENDNVTNDTLDHHADADDEGMASASESEDDDDDILGKGNKLSKTITKKLSRRKKGGDEEESIDSDAENHDDDDSDQDILADDPSSKMSNAMLRILGTSAPQQSVVLAKTKTPLQKMQQEEKEKAKALRERRKANREKSLMALHIPLSVATTNSIPGESQISVAKELENERLHRRVATRGVVALFNAISQHQKGAKEVSHSHIYSCCLDLMDCQSPHPIDWKIHSLTSNRRKLSPRKNRTPRNLLSITFWNLSKMPQCQRRLIVVKSCRRFLEEAKTMIAMPNRQTGMLLRKTT